jgi:hypothetical protein
LDCSLSGKGGGILTEIVLNLYIEQCGHF